MLPVKWQLLILLGMAAFFATLWFIAWAVEKTYKEDPGSPRNDARKGE
jgi:hypothetical protein